MKGQNLRVNLIYHDIRSWKKNKQTNKTNNARNTTQKQGQFILFTKFFQALRGCNCKFELPRLGKTDSKLLQTMDWTDAPLVFYVLWQLFSKRTKVFLQAKWLIRPELLPALVAWSDSEYIHSPLDRNRMLVHRRVTPSINSTVSICGTPWWREALWA